MSEILTHIVLPIAWEKQLTSDYYITESLSLEGFIHLSTPEQLEGTLQRFFKGIESVFIVYVDAALLEAPLVFEEVPNHGTFPHLFGPLNKSAVIRIEKRSLS